MALPTDEKIQEWRDYMNGLSLKEMAEQFKLLQTEYEDAKEVAAKIYHEFDFLRKQIIPQIMDDMGLATANIKGVGRIQIGSQLSAKQLDKAGLMEWLRAEGHPDIVAETVNSSTLASFIKHQLAEGEPIPNETIVEISAYEVASVVKA